MRRFSQMSIWLPRSPRSVVSARSTFHDRFSISASSCACWYSNCPCGNTKTNKQTIETPSRNLAALVRWPECYDSIYGSFRGILMTS